MISEAGGATSSEDLFIGTWNLLEHYVKICDQLEARVKELENRKKNKKQQLLNKKKFAKKKIAKQEKANRLRARAEAQAGKSKKPEKADKRPPVVPMEVESDYYLVNIFWLRKYFWTGSKLKKIPWVLGSSEFPKNPICLCINTCTGCRF